MKQSLTAFAMTQSMFCALPFPCRNWDEKARSKMLLFLPVIGLEIGVIWITVQWILSKLHLPAPASALVLCAVPYLCTGFLHLDGFLDVVDAICSWRDPEQRRAILKDSHVGSFAVVWCIFLLLGSYAMAASIPAGKSCLPLLVIPVVSRCCSALAVMHLPPMSTSQFHETTDYPRWHSFVLAAVVIFSTALSIALWKSFVPLAVLIGYGLALRRSYRSLEGMNGDIAGFSLCIAELCGVAALALI